MFSAILAILLLPLSDLGLTKGLQFRPLSKLAFFIFVANFLVLMQLGAKHVESPYIELGQICTAYYFAHFLIIVPIVSLIENTLVDLTLYNKVSNTLYNKVSNSNTFVDWVLSDNIFNIIKKPLV